MADVNGRKEAVESRFKNEIAAKKATNQQLSATKKNTPTKLQVKIYSPYKTYFSGDADSISALNETGPFDVLPRHHNFISILLAGELTVRVDEGEQRYKIDRGVMHVKNDLVTVFLDI